MDGILQIGRFRSLWRIMFHPDWYRTSECEARISEYGVWSMENGVFTLCRPRWFLAVDKACVERHGQGVQISLDRSSQLIIYCKKSREPALKGSLCTLYSVYITLYKDHILFTSLFHTFAIFGGSRLSSENVFSLL